MFNYERLRRVLLRCIIDQIYFKNWLERIHSLYIQGTLDHKAVTFLKFGIVNTYR